MKCNVTRQSATWLQQADLISALCETRAWLQAKPPWLQAKYTVVALKCSPAHRTSANIINIYFWLLETCTKCSYFIRKTYDPALNGWHLKYEYIVRRPRIYRGPAVCGWASFQTTGAWYLRSISNLVPRFALLSILHSFILPIYDYGSVVYDQWRIKGGADWATARSPQYWGGPNP